MAKHYVSGSGMAGCLYDNGPHFAKTREDAIDAVLFAFDDLSPATLRAARSELKRCGVYYFSQPRLAGADYCEVSCQEGPCPEGNES